MGAARAVGATGGVGSGTHDISPRWSRAAHEHPADADGIVYRPNHDNGQLCVALFGRCRSRLRAQPPEALISDRRRLASLFDRYKVGLG
jgi:hypothetical protein